MDKKGTDIKGELRRFIISNYLKNDKFQLADNDSFLEKGIVDSIGVIELIAFIQARYKIKIVVTEIVPENFDSLNNLEKYIKQRLKSS